MGSIDLQQRPGDLVSAHGVGQAGKAAMGLARALRQARQRLALQSRPREGRATAEQALMTAAFDDLAAVTQAERDARARELQALQDADQRSRARAADRHDAEAARYDRRLQAMGSDEILLEVGQVLQGQQVEPHILDILSAHAKGADPAYHQQLRDHAKTHNLYQPHLLTDEGQRLTVETRALDAALQQEGGVPIVVDGAPSVIGLSSLLDDLDIGGDRDQ